MNQNLEQDRRTFLLSAIYGLWALIGLLLAIPASIYLLWPPRPKKEDVWVEAGTVGELKLDAPAELVFRRNRVDGWKVASEKSTTWAVKVSDQEVIAFAPQCPHLGCAYHWNAAKHEFLCPCHASTFSIQGDVLTGPAPRALDRYELKIEQGKVLVGAIRKSGGDAG
ncbi:MAG: ubiquinol-cytochrome c reductase iron-sulfur subunit [Acidimicrobiia bacterium]|nr:ubiquinol-cytochrome c reductase iron-sulfur subunit [Acidimicrobiia bacterium]